MKHLGHVPKGAGTSVLELDVGGRYAAKVAPGPGERDPGSRRRLLIVADHVGERIPRAAGIVDQIRPVLERGAELRHAGGVVIEVAVRNRLALTIRGETSQARQDATCRVRDQERAG